ncbi:MAG: hypothetical protein ABIJ92_03380 [Candidatus Aenigmatarchaeota archaeon]
MKFLVLLTIAAIIFVSGCTAAPAKDHAFTNCLTENGISEYGAYWCPNCARVKLTLGDAHHNVDYHECDPKCVVDDNGNLPDFCNGVMSETDVCLEKGVNKYPTWIKDGQQIYVGSDLTKLAEASGCQLPE